MSRWKKSDWLGSCAALAFGISAGCALAGEAPVLKATGSLRIETGLLDDSASDNSGEADGFIEDFGDSSTELTFSARGQTEGGLDFGARAKLRTRNTGTAVEPQKDEAYVFFRDDWGTFHFGEDDSVIDNMLPGGETVLVGGRGYDGSIGLRGNHIGGARRFPSLVFSSGDASKIAYYTPGFAGLDAGLSFTPEPTTSTGSSNRDNQLDLAIRYRQDIQQLGLEVGLGYLIADEQGGFREAEGLMAGMTLSWQAWSLGLGYGDNGKSGVADDTPADGGGWWDAGLSYNLRRGALSFGYLESYEGQSDDSRDRLQAGFLDAEYYAAEGLTLYAELQWAQSRDESAGRLYETQAVVIGTLTRF